MARGWRRSPAVAHDAGAELVLIGLPSMRNPKYGARIARLNSVTEQHAARAGRDLPADVEHYQQ